MAYDPRFYAWKQQVEQHLLARIGRDSAGIDDWDYRRDFARGYGASDAADRAIRHDLSGFLSKTYYGVCVGEA